MTTKIPCGNYMYKRNHLAALCEVHAHDLDTVYRSGRNPRVDVCVPQNIHTTKSNQWMRVEKEKSV